jgi:hypothetical protein
VSNCSAGAVFGIALTGGATAGFAPACCFMRLVMLEVNFDDGANLFFVSACLSALVEKAVSGGSLDSGGLVLAPGLEMPTSLAPGLVAARAGGGLAKDPMDALGGGTPRTPYFAGAVFAAGLPSPQCRPPPPLTSAKALAPSSHLASLL